MLKVASMSNPNSNFSVVYNPPSLKLWRDKNATLRKSSKNEGWGFISNDVELSTGPELLPLP